MGTKAKEIKSPIKSEEKSDNSKVSQEPAQEEQIITMSESVANKDNSEKPAIPGLVFKTDLERRPSKKKRKSKSTTNLTETSVTYYLSNATDDDVKESEIELQS